MITLYFKAIPQTVLVQRTERREGDVGPGPWTDARRVPNKYVLKRIEGAVVIYIPTSCPRYVEVGETLRMNEVDDLSRQPKFKVIMEADCQ